jgi:hypothetical protein
VVDRGSVGKCDDLGGEKVMARMTSVGDWLSHCVVEVVVLVLGMVQLVNGGIARGKCRG